MIEIQDKNNGFEEQKQQADKDLSLILLYKPRAEKIKQEILKSIFER